MLRNRRDPRRPYARKGGFMQSGFVQIGGKPNRWVVHLLKYSGKYGFSYENNSTFLFNRAR